ncbi:hypothetical protein VNO77_13319 [Canavalia gladiata]|uniref:Uncharacterized protein n=1 Tax=Canavalia gladiata TaxID=3824 RepID=A0AAN9QQ76_CANGL
MPCASAKHVKFGEKDYGINLVKYRKVEHEKFNQPKKTLIYRNRTVLFTIFVYTIEYLTCSPVLFNPFPTSFSNSHSLTEYTQSVSKL